MEFSKLSASEKMSVYASVAVVVLAIYAVANDWGSLPVFSLLGAALVLAVIFLPQMSPGTKLPGSNGTLMLVGGGAAALFWAIAALSWISWIFGHLGRIDTWVFVIGLAAALWLGWLSWKVFQAEGGKFIVGMNGGGASATDAASAPTTPPPAAPPAQPAAPAAPPAPPAAPPQAAPATPPPAAPPAEQMPSGDAEMGSGEDEASS